MKGNIVTIIKKELARFFGDKRMILSTVLLPGIMIYVVYSFMGSAMSGLFSTDEDYRFNMAVMNLPASISAMLPEDQVAVDEISQEDIEASKTAVEDKELDLLMVFPESFDQAVAAYETGDTAAPAVELYYNSTRTESATAYNMVISLLDGYESSLTNRFDVNPGGEGFDLATEKDSAGFMFSSMMPMLMMIFLFSGCMAVAPESISGEKERGTIATMLITPMKRSQLAVGKIIALSVVALLSGASSTIGTLLAMPKLMGAASDNMSAAVYGVGDYALLAAVILSTVLLLVAVISIVSAYAKTIKEAQTYVTPLMIVVMLVGVTAMFGGGPQSGLAFYMIPVYNSVQCMAGIFSFSVMPQAVIITVIVNLVVSVICGFVLTKMFNSEKIMFNK